MALLINGIDIRPGRIFPSETFVLPDGSTTTVDFGPYDLGAPGDVHSQNGESAAGQRIRRLREAIHHIVHRISTYTPANTAFYGLTGRRTLTDLIGRRDIVICYSRTNFTVMGASGDMRLSLTGRCFHGSHASGRRVEATIIHELAHLNGASTEPNSLEAENVLRQCRMGDRFDRRNTG